MTKDGYRASTIAVVHDRGRPIGEIPGLKQASREIGRHPFGNGFIHRGLLLSDRGTLI